VGKLVVTVGVEIGDMIPDGETAGAQAVTRQSVRAGKGFMASLLRMDHLCPDDPG